MSSGAVDTVALSRPVGRAVAGRSTLPYSLRASRDRWVRFHTLPGSKRYPETEDEYGIVVARHNTVLADLVAGPDLLVATAGYSEAREPQEPYRPRETVAVHPDATYWTRVCIDDEPGFESWTHLHVSQLAWSAGCLDPLLRQVADDVIADVLLADQQIPQKVLDYIDLARHRREFDVPAPRQNMVRPWCATVQCSTSRVGHQPRGARLPGRPSRAPYSGPAVSRLI